MQSLYNAFTNFLYDEQDEETDKQAKQQCSALAKEEVRELLNILNVAVQVGL